MKILVTGSRDWPEPQVVHNALTEAGPSVVIHGACPTGADAQAEDWCVQTGTPQDVHPADWGRYGRRAGFLRNKEMIDERPDLVLAFCRRGSAGTSMTVDLARAAGIEVRLWTVD